MTRFGGLAPYAAVIAALAFTAAVALLLRSSFVDDAYIGFRYVANLRAGYGFTFHPFDRVEGVTNAGWLLLLTPLAALLGEMAAAKVLGFLFAAATVVLCHLIAVRLAKGRPLWLYAYPITLLVAANADFALFSALGMETALLAFLICAAAYLALLDRAWVACAALCAFAFLVHPEAGLIFPLFALLELAGHRRDARRLALPGLAFVALLAAFTLARHAYYGDWLPNTFAAKPASLAAVLQGAYDLLRGANTNVSVPYANVLALALMGLGLVPIARRSRTAAAFLGAAALTGLAFAVYAPADWTGMGRYFAPYVPLAAILFWWGLADVHERLLARRVGQKVVSLLLAVYAVALVLVGVGDVYLHLERSFSERYPGYVVFSRNLVEPSLWIRDHVPAGAVIATRRIGALGYYSEHAIFDYKFGLVDREIAQLRRRTGAELTYPTDPALAEIWRERAPDYVLEDGIIVEQAIAESGGTAERFQIHGLDYSVVQRFPIGEQAEWLLCERMGAR